MNISRRSLITGASCVFALSGCISNPLSDSPEERVSEVINADSNRYDLAQNSMFDAFEAYGQGNYAKAESLSAGAEDQFDIVLKNIHEEFYDPDGRAKELSDLFENHVTHCKQACSSLNLSSRERINYGETEIAKDTYQKARSHLDEAAKYNEKLMNELE